MGRTNSGRRFAAILLLLAAAGALARCKKDSPMQAGGCEVTRTIIEFDVVAIGDSKDASFSINNTGESTITGEVSLAGEACPFTIPIGGGAYSISPGGSRPVVVRFTPIVVGGTSCRVEVGGGCPPVDLSGQGAEAPVCVVRPTSLDFGVVAVGAAGERTLTIANDGAGVLIGTLGLSPLCFELSLVGEGAFRIAPHDTQAFVVRYAPAAETAMACTLAMGTDACVRVPVSGSGGPTPTCAVDATSLDFGTLAVGDSAERSFTITNTGIGVLAGSAGGGSCPGLRAVGESSYELGPSESATITARLVPTEPGPLSCAMLTGSPFCGEIPVAAFVERAPTCSLSVESLEFGTVPVGESEDRGFTITNVGDGTLSGTVASPCGEFAVVGTGAFALGPGASADFTVRFAPKIGGARVCAMATGAASCPSVSARGTGLAPPTCAVSPGQLEFGAVEVGTSRDRALTIKNVGGGTVSGTVSLPIGCPAFALLGSGDYEIAEADSQVLTIRFTPISEDTASCTLETGSALCPDVALAGSGFRNPECALSADTLDFGAVPVGGHGDRTLTITNTGGSTLSGVAGGCEAFTIVGDGTYSLAANQSRILTVRFSPKAEGPAGCTLNPGSELCGAVAVLGSGVIVQGCDVTPTLLDFGTVTLGGSRDTSFTITNTGNGTLAGSVAASGCAGFSIIGEPAYDLAPNASQPFTVRFAPAGSGPAECAITTGDAACLPVSATGDGEPAPDCAVSTATLAFGSVSVGQSADRTFSIRNSGGGLLSGTISESCPAYAIIGSASYDLAAADSQIFTVRFTPSGAGLVPCTIETGADSCADVAASGTGDATPLCEVSPDTLRFGTLLMGQSDTLAITLTNNGGGTMSGTATESCTRFFFVGSAAYSVGPGLSHDLKIRYSPNSSAPETCAVNPGSGCPSVVLIGGGCAAVCSYTGLSGNALSFGSLTVGQCLEKSFTIKNTGCSSLSGTVPASCGTDFTVTGGSGTFNLAANATRLVKVRFKPIAVGAAACALSLGTASCADVMLSGTGTAGPSCSVNKTTLAYGTVRVNSGSNQVFRVTNGGSGTLAASVGFSGSCPDFLFVGTTQASILAGGFQDFTVQFRPVSPGAKSCTVQVTGTVSSPCDDATPADLCSNLSVTGTGAALICATDNIVGNVTPTCGACHIGGAGNPPLFDCSSMRARANVSDPFNSLLLQKARGEQMHGGGAPWGDTTNDDYERVLQWITEGAF